MEKTLAIQLQELREQIAKEIEKIQPQSNIDLVKAGYTMARNYAAAIARGKK